mmetsp:Transcript_39391/g.111627  ORF Transcript_39391/g.111627 Transcript_39391/m.111627 type:complete len:228 (-) Transcript_39391:816-1499(-)
MYIVMARPPISPTTPNILEISASSMLPSARARKRPITPATIAAIMVPMMVIRVVLSMRIDLSGSTISTSARGMSLKRLRCMLRENRSGSCMPLSPAPLMPGFADSAGSGFTFSRYSTTTSLNRGSTSSTVSRKPTSRDFTVGNRRLSVFLSTYLAARWAAVLSDMNSLEAPWGLVSALLAPSLLRPQNKLFRVSNMRQALPMMSMSSRILIFSEMNIPSSRATSRPR